MGKLTAVGKAIEEVLPLAREAKVARRAMTAVEEAHGRQLIQNDLNATLDAFNEGAANRIVQPKTINLSTTSPPIVKTTTRNLNSAKKMLDRGIDEDTIFQKTGWFRGEKDKVWRASLSSADMHIRTENIQSVAKSKFGLNIKEGQQQPVTMKLSDVINGEEYFQIYPQMKDYPIHVNLVKEKDGTVVLAHNPEESLASFSPLTKEFKLNNPGGVALSGEISPKQSVLHEMEHAMQTLGDITNGTSAKVLSSEATNYRLAAIMVDTLKNPEAYLALERSDIENALRTVGVKTKTEIETLSNVIERSIRNTKGNEKEIENWVRLRNLFATRTAKWIMEVDSTITKENFRTLVLGMNNMEIDSLASLRYQSDLGEMEARLSEAMSEIPKDKLNKLSVNPHQLMRFLDGDALARVQKEIPEMKRMRAAGPVENAIIQQ